MMLYLIKIMFEQTHDTIDVYISHTPFLLRLLEGLSTGSMTYTAFDGYTTSYEKGVYMIQWLGSFIFHVFPSYATWTYDLLSIHELILSRYERFDRTYGPLARLAYTLSFVLTHVVFYQSCMTPMSYIRMIQMEGEALFCIASISVAYKTQQSFRYILVSILTIITFTLKQLSFLKSCYIWSGVLSIVFHVLLGVNAHIENSAPRLYKSVSSRYHWYDDAYRACMLMYVMKYTNMLCLSSVIPFLDAL